jgi:hypothetical protein
VAGAGALEADGWLVRWSTPAGSRFAATAQYSRTHAQWAGQGSERLAAVVPAALRLDREDLHDLTTSMTADIRETATRVLIVCKVNNGFVNPAGSAADTGVDARFGIQVNQALPMTIAGTRWEVLVGLRDLFRDPMDSASVYDELLVVRPPKRLMGGFLVRF